MQYNVLYGKQRNCNRDTVERWAPGFLARIRRAVGGLVLKVINYVVIVSPLGSYIKLVEQTDNCDWTVTFMEFLVFCGRVQFN